MDEPICVLHVDDEPYVVELVAETLEATTDRIDVIHVTSVEAVLDRLVAGEPDQVEYRVVRPDIEGRWVHGHSKSIFNGKGGATRIVGFVRDVTDRRRRTERLARFTSGVSYDLRNPFVDDPGSPRAGHRGVNRRAPRGDPPAPRATGYSDRRPPTPGPGRATT